MERGYDQMTEEQRKCHPEGWHTVSFTVRRPGCTAWATDIPTWGAARWEREAANRVVPGHRVYAEQKYIGARRTVEI